MRYDSDPDESGPCFLSVDYRLKPKKYLLINSLRLVSEDVNAVQCIQAQLVHLCLCLEAEVASSNDTIASIVCLLVLLSFLVLS